MKSLGQGRYELLEPLGEGGMATVWRARDTVTGEHVAIKILNPVVAERASYRSRFLAEARTMRRLCHPNVLRVGEFGEDEGRPWFTMEIVDGGALIDRLERTGKVPPLEALDITFQVLQALALAHLASVVHRDVKPDNVLLNKDGSVRLSDFGIARIRNERVDHHTMTGVAMGTVGYMSPEQRESAKDAGPGADLYATGATLYAAVCGLQPPDLFAAHIDPKLLEPVPPAVREVVRKATAYRADKRYRTARAMAEDVAKARDAIARGMGLEEQLPTWMARFDRLISEAMKASADLAPAQTPTLTPASTPSPTPASTPGSAPTPAPDPPSEPSSPRAAPWLIAGALLVVLLVVLGALLMQ